MRKILLPVLVIGIAMLFVGCSKPADNAAELAKLEAESLIWFDYYQAADADALANLYAEDAVIMPPGTLAISGKAGIKDFLGSDSAAAKAAGITLVKGEVNGIGIEGNTGWISGNYSVSDPTGATIDSGSYMSIHRRTASGWLYTRDIWNSDQPAKLLEPDTGEEPAATE